MMQCYFSIIFDFLKMQIITHYTNFKTHYWVTA